MGQERKKGVRATVKLKVSDRKELDILTSKGVSPVRVIKRAHLLLLMDDGLSAPQAAQATRITPKTARKIARRYMKNGLERAIYEDPRPGPTPRITMRESQEIIAMVCSNPPMGQARWSVRLIATEAVSRGLVPRVGRETVRVLLQSHELKPWREKNVGYSRANTRIHHSNGRPARSLCQTTK